MDFAIGSSFDECRIVVSGDIYGEGAEGVTRQISPPSVAT
jgi:hypothetical protein